MAGEEPEEETEEKGPEYKGFASNSCGCYHIGPPSEGECPWYDNWGADEDGVIWVEWYYDREYGETNCEGHTHTEESWDCHGMCWDDATEDFAECLRDTGLFEKAAMYPSGFEEKGRAFHIMGLQLWDGPISGGLLATDAKDLITKMGVNSHWNMNWKMYEDRIEYSLSHHDAPMGSTTVLVPAPECPNCEWPVGFNNCCKDCLEHKTHPN